MRSHIRSKNQNAIASSNLINKQCDRILKPTLTKSHSRTIPTKSAISGA
ncbi:MAG: hypothetical protein HC903_31740 [Methylacidiphilales bacterium]|nr:hypothetical protein [Candidatus Methylacidiphilales bacterium]NJR19506.1 hypothetical protein [Calothrix sp. CSU_2_0]